MYSIKKESVIYWKLNPTAFEKLNKDIVGFDTQRLGSAMKPVNTILSLGDELRMIMPIVLGTNPNSVSSNWDELVAKYWHSLCITIPSSGKTLEIGFNFDIKDGKRKEFIEEIAKSKGLKTDEDLGIYVMGNNKGKPNVTEDEKWRYGTPINPEEYLWWRYALINKEVANTVLDINKSPNIRFYLHSDEEQKEIQKKQLDISKIAIDIYNNIMKADNSSKRIDEILSYLMQDQMFVLARMSETEKQIKIIEYLKDKPQEFSTAAQDKSITFKVEILKLINANILRKIGGTELIVDAVDSNIIIGEGMDKAVDYLRNPGNKESVDLYRGKLKSLV